MWSLKEREREKRLGNRRNVLVTARNGLDRSISFAFKSESKYCPAEKSFLPAGGQCSDGEMQSNRRSTRKKRPFQSVISAQRIYIYNSYLCFVSIEKILVVWMDYEESNDYSFDTNCEIHSKTTEYIPLANHISPSLLSFNRKDCRSLDGL